MCSRFFEPPPPTGQTEHGIGLKFCMWSPLGYLFRLTEAIFDTSPPSRDLGVDRATPGGPKMAKNFFRFFRFFSTDFVNLLSFLMGKAPTSPYLPLKQCKDASKSQAHTISEIDEKVVLDIASQR